MSGIFNFFVLIYKNWAALLATLLALRPPLVGFPWTDYNSYFYSLPEERFGPSNCMKIRRLLTSNAGT